MRKFIPALFILLSCFSATAQNLILNGSCDSALVGGKIPYWQEITGTGWSQRTSDPLPYSGPAYFYAPSIALAELQQTINLGAFASSIDSGIQKFRFTGYVLAYVQSPPDESNIIIRFGITTDTLALYSFGPYNQTTAWLKIDTLLSVPTNTRSVNILLRSVRRSGSNNDGYYDELSLTPEKQCITKTISVTPDSATICPGSTIQLCAPAGYATYGWNTQDTTACIQAHTEGLYQITATDVNGCAATSNLVPVRVYDLSLFPLPLTVSNDTICSGDSSLVCAPDGFNSYQWNVTGTSNCIEVKQAGNYYVTVTDANQCTVESSHMQIAVHPVPSVSIIVNGDTISSYNAVAYQWYRDDEPVNGATSQMYIATIAGNYAVQVTDINGCTARSAPVAIAITTVTALEDSKWKVYPNPSTGKVILQVNAEWIGSKMQLYDVLGNLVFQSEIRDPKSEILLPPSPGLYFLNLRLPGSNMMIKLTRL